MERQNTRRAKIIFKKNKVVQKSKQYSTGRKTDAQINGTE